MKPDTAKYPDGIHRKMIRKVSQIPGATNGGVVNHGAVVEYVRGVQRQIPHGLFSGRQASPGANRDADTATDRMVNGVDRGIGHFPLAVEQRAVDVQGEKTIHDRPEIKKRRLPESLRFSS